MGRSRHTGTPRPFETSTADAARAQARLQQTRAETILQNKETLITTSGRERRAAGDNKSLVDFEAVQRAPIR